MYRESCSHWIQNICKLICFTKYSKMFTFTKKYFDFRYRNYPQDFADQQQSSKLYDIFCLDLINGVDENFLY